MDAWENFHRLFQSLSNYEGSTAYADVLEPWLSKQHEMRDWLVSLGRREGTPIPRIDDEESWTLYALSRILDLLIGVGTFISPEQYAAFVEALGMKVLKPQQFSPFYHEVVELEQGDSPFSPVAIREFEWPCVMLENMMISRARVRVLAGIQVLAPGIADASTLYWAYWRNDRPHQDLSHGWGSNSQWRTRFRRDLLVGDSFYFNVDGREDLAVQGDDVEHDLTLSERVELLTHRCFVRCPKPHRDLWPYDDRLKLSVAACSGDAGASSKVSLLSRLLRRQK